MLILLLIIKITILVKSCLTYNVLGIFPTPAKSHFLGAKVLLSGLAADGHNITVISPFSPKESPPNMVYYTIGGIDEALNGVLSNLLSFKSTYTFQQLDIIYELGIFIANYTLTHPRMVEFLKRTDLKFDVIIIESACFYALLGLGHHFGAPVVVYSPMGANKWNMDMVGTPAPLSFVPHHIMKTLSDRMSFTQRLENTLITAYDLYKFEQHLKHEDAIYQKVFLGEKKTTVYEMYRNVSLVLVNQHFAIAHPQPYVTNMIDIGGIHINHGKPNRLPNEIWHFLENAPNGVIIFSMGSLINSSKIPTATREGLLRAFGTLKQRVLWKWEDPDLPGKPDNVMISSWLPQEDVLAHKNIKVFITHGGLLSTMEAIYHAVPIIGIPIFGDQFVNMLRAQNTGYGLTISMSNLTENSIIWAIDEILSNAKYLRTAKQMSIRFRDVPMKPLDLAKYWVNYVVRHNGARHLRSAGQDLSFFAYHCLDAFALIAALLFGFILGITILVRKIGRKICSWISQNKKSKNKIKIN